MPRVVAFLQNAWFKNPERVAMVAENGARRYPEDGDFKSRLRDIWMMGLRNCKTGRRLVRGLTEELFDAIHWDNASPKIGSSASSKFPADLDHMKWVLGEQKPEVVLAFGEVATAALPKVWTGESLYCTHPAARNFQASELEAMAHRLRQIMETRREQAADSAN